MGSEVFRFGRVSRMDGARRGQKVHAPCRVSLVSGGVHVCSVDTQVLGKTAGRILRKASGQGNGSWRGKPAAGGGFALYVSICKFSPAHNQETCINKERQRPGAAVEVRAPS